MSGEDPRIGLIRQAFADYAERDVEGLGHFLHPEVESEVFQPLLNADRWSGPAGFVEMTRQWQEPFGEITYEILGIELPDERNALVSVHQEATGAGSGVPVELDVWFLVEFEDQRAIRFQIHASRDSAVEHL
jgi:ketosteroid isomerase-like protein